MNKMNTVQEFDYEVYYLEDDYLNRGEELSSESQSNSDELSELIPLDNLFLEDLQLDDEIIQVDDEIIQVDDEDCTLDANEASSNHLDSNCATAEEEELQESSLAYNLNDDIWLHIFNFLPGNDIMKARQTCLRFNQLINNCSKFMENIVLQFRNSHFAYTGLDTLYQLQAKYSNVCIDDLMLINEKMNRTFWPQNAGYIKHLELKNIFINVNFTTIFKYAVNLESLKIINCDFIDLALDELENVYYHKLRDFTSIKTTNPMMLHKFIDTHSVAFRTLDVQSCWRTHQGYNIELLGLVKNNQSSLRHLTISDDGLILKDLNAIQHLRLFSFTHHVRSAFREYTDEDIINFLRKQRDLRVLNFDCINILPKLSVYLPKLRELNTQSFVKIEGIERPPVNLFNLNSLRFLKKLNLHIHDSFDFFPIGRRIFPLYMPNINEFVLHFAHSKARYSSILINKIPYVMPNLRILKLINIMSDELPIIFKRCTKLRELSLVRYEDAATYSVKRFIFKHIRKLVHLEKLELFGFADKMDGDTIRKHLKFPNLKVLKLIEKEPISRFYNEDINLMFKHCPQIKEMYFSNSIILNNGAIQRSKHLKNLKLLHVEDIYWFNSTSLFQLIKTCKKLKRLYVPEEIMRNYAQRIFMANFLMMMDGFRFYTGCPLTTTFRNLGKCTRNTVLDYEFQPFIPESIHFGALCAPDDEVLIK